MLQRQLADLPIEPRAVDRDRLLVRPERRDDRGHGDVVQRDASDLGQDRPFPGLIAEASLATPGGTRVGMELAMTAIGERAIVPQLPTTDAFEEAAEQVDAIPVLGSPAAGLGAPNLLHPRPQLV
ncbi:MAG: hypothetical protein M0Z49_00965 [Chloroflexi bacterium]|nr:hypothetical protein [Chloroflexota bacterium]